MRIYKRVTLAMPVVVAFGLCPARHHVDPWAPEAPESDHAPTPLPQSILSVSSTSANALTKAITLTRFPGFRLSSSDFHLE